MGYIKSFRDLIVWQKAADLAVAVFKVTENFPKSELYGLTSQVRRAVISISSNIAEGFKRSHGKEKNQFYNIAYGSAAEIESQFEIAKKLNFLSQKEYEETMAAITEVSKMMGGLIKSTSQNTKSAHVGLATFLLIAISSISYLLYPILAGAAELKITSSQNELGIGSQFEIILDIDTKGESVNAIEGKMFFPGELLEAQEVRDGNSIVNLWIERPKPGNGSEINFSGIIPGGYSGKDARIFSVIFEAKKSGEGMIEIKDIRVLLNDGAGTSAGVITDGLDFKIQDLAGELLNPKSNILYPTDSNPPESFVPEVGSDPNIFGGKYFIAFATQDKGSGIDYYEVKEKWWPLFFLNGKWQRAESPFELKDQHLGSYIYVRAVDKFGNERVEVISPRPLTRYESRLFWCIIVVVVSVAFCIIKIWRRKKAKSTLN